MVGFSHVLLQSRSTVKKALLAAATITLLWQVSRCRAAFPEQQLFQRSSARSAGAPAPRLRGTDFDVYISDESFQLAGQLDAPTRSPSTVQPPAQLGLQPAPGAANRFNRRSSSFQPQEEAFDLGAGVGLAAGAGSSLLMAGGYIDNAQIRSIVRFRFDAGFDLNRPDRAEYFYATWDGIADHKHAIKGTDQLISQRGARGPLEIPAAVDYQEFSLSLEWACSDRISVFSEFPLRFISFQGDLLDEEAFNTPTFNHRYDLEPTHTSGPSDLQLGFKYALMSDADQILTFQLRTFVPTGDSRLALGTGHVSFEPALLYFGRFTEEAALMAQAKLWAPTAGGPNAGNIAIYGLGLSHEVYRSRQVRITPVAEFVGWTVLDGFESLSSPTGAAVVPNTAIIPRDDLVRRFSDGAPLPLSPDPRPAPTSHGVQDATGKTIVNAKLGIRAYLSERNDIYVGWGRALTGTRWYQDLVRVDCRRSF